MASSNLFAPPTEEELGSTPKRKPQVDMFAPPTDAELFSPPTEAELGAPSRDKIQQEIEDRSAFDKPAVIPEPVTNAELNQIAAKYQVKAEDLRSALPYFGGRPQDGTAGDLAAGAAGLVGDIAFSVPQKLYKLAQDPKMGQALDEMQDLAAGRKSYAMKVAEIATPLGAIGGVVKGAKAAKAAAGTAKAATSLKKATAIGAGSGALGGFGASKQGDEVSSTLLGTGAGAVLGGGIHTAPKAYRKISEVLKSKKDIKPTDATGISMHELTTEAGKRLDSEDPDKLIEALVFEKVSPYDLPDKAADDLLRKLYTKDELTVESKRFLGKGEDGRPLRITPADLIIEKVDKIRNEFTSYAQNRKAFNAGYEDWTELQRTGTQEGWLGKEFRKFQEAQEVGKIREEKGLYTLDPESKTAEVLGKGIDAKPRLNTIDERYGQSSSKELDKLSRAENLMHNDLNKINRELDNISDRAAATGVRESVINSRIAAGIEMGDNGQAFLSKQENDIAQSLRKITDDIYTNVTSEYAKKGLDVINIPKIENYVHRITKTAAEIQGLLEARLRQPVGKNLEELKKFAEYISGNEFAGDTKQLLSTVREFLNSENSEDILNTIARGTRQRTGGEMPAFIREFNMFKIVDRYSRDMLSNIYRREPLARLRDNANFLESVGAKSEANYIRNIITDTTGVRKGTVANITNRIKNELARSLDPMIEKAQALGNKRQVFLLNTLKESGELPAFLHRQIYANILGGLNPKPAFQNILGGITRTAPELGGTYGYTTYGRGLVYALKNWKTLSKEIIDKGLVPTEFSKAGRSALSEGLRANPWLKIPVDKLDRFNDLLMTMYMASEKLNRVSIMGTSRMMANDLIQGNKQALNSLKKFPSYVQRDVAAAGKNEEAIYDILALHLNSTTAFNYTRSSQYEFARTMGPIFATFAKWPTSIAGELHSEIKTKGLPQGLLRSAERYAAPLLAFSFIDSLLHDQLQEPGRLQTVVGKSGTTSAAPISAISGVLTGDVYSPAATDILITNTLVPALNGDKRAFGRGLDKATQAYFPGAGIIRMISETIPTLIAGEKPEDGTPLKPSRLLKD